MFSHRPSCLPGPVSRALGRFRKQDSNASHHDPQIRMELVKRIRRAIREGHYETSERWEAALELLFQRLQG